jgi:hypothetical protein
VLPNHPLPSAGHCNIAAIPARPRWRIIAQSREATCTTLQLGDEILGIAVTIRDRRQVAGRDGIARRCASASRRWHSRSGMVSAAKCACRSPASPPACSLTPDAPSRHGCASIARTRHPHAPQARRVRTSGRIASIGSNAPVLSWPALDYDDCWSTAAGHRARERGRQHAALHVGCDAAQLVMPKPQKLQRRRRSSVHWRRSARGSATRRTGHRPLRPSPDRPAGLPQNSCKHEAACCLFMTWMAPLQSGLPCRRHPRG